MRRPAARRSALPARIARRARGFTLVELMLVMVLMGAVAAFALPQFGLAGEETRVDQAGGVLRSIWIAERMHWIETGAFAASLSELTDMRLIEAPVAALAEPFAYEIVSADESGFVAEAHRAGSLQWSGTIGIDETGVLSGDVSNGAGKHVAPEID